MPLYLRRAPINWCYINRAGLELCLPYPSLPYPSPAYWGSPLPMCSPAAVPLFSVESRLLQPVMVATLFEVPYS